MLSSKILKERIGNDKLDRMMFDNLSNYLTERDWEMTEPTKDCEATVFLKKDLKITISKSYTTTLYAAIGDEFYEIGFVDDDDEYSNSIKSNNFLYIINNY
jgi:hypothetical protein